jgi:hypothetical protein
MASPNTQYDFILNDPMQKPKRQLPLPQFPRNVWLMIFVSVGVLLIAVVFSLVNSGKKVSSDKYVETLSRGNEIDRVSKLAEPLLQDASTQSLAATTESVMESSNSEIGSYLVAKKVKLAKGAVDAYQDNRIDEQLKTAATTNSIDTLYLQYLQNALPGYQAAAKAAYNKSLDADKPTFSDAYYNSQEILAAAK